MARPLNLNEKIAVRLTAEEKLRLQADASLAGISVSEIVRRQYFNQKIVADVDLATIRELRRLGGLLKMIHIESNGAYSEKTMGMLNELGRAIEKLSKVGSGLEE